MVLSPLLEMLANFRTGAYGGFLSLLKSASATQIKLAKQFIADSQIMGMSIMALMPKQIPKSRKTVLL
jgi:hypothetical protein